MMSSLVAFVKQCLQHVYACVLLILVYVGQLGPHFFRPIYHNYSSQSHTGGSLAIVRWSKGKSGTSCGRVSELNTTFTNPNIKPSTLPLHIKSQYT